MPKTRELPKELTGKVVAYRDAWRKVYRSKELNKVDLQMLADIQDVNPKKYFKAQDTIAEEYGHNRVTINQSFLKLLKFGYLEIVDKPKRGTKKPTTYKLTDSLVPPVKYIFSVAEKKEENRAYHVVPTLHVMLPTDYMTKKETVPVMLSTDYTNGMNGKDITEEEETLNTYSISSKTQEGILPLLSIEKQKPADQISADFTAKRELTKSIAPVEDCGSWTLADLDDPDFLARVRRETSE